MCIRDRHRIGIFHQAADPALEGFDPGYQPVSDPGSHRGLRYVEYQEDNGCKKRDPDDFVGDHAVDLILGIFIFCKYFSLFYFLDNSIYKIKPLPVCRFHGFFVRKVDICLYIRGFLACAL